MKPITPLSSILSLAHLIASIYVSFKLFFKLAFEYLAYVSFILEIKLGYLTLALSLFTDFCPIEYGGLVMIAVIGTSCCFFSRSLFVPNISSSRVSWRSVLSKVSVKTIPSKGL